MSSKVQYVSKSFSKISDLLDNKKKGNHFLRCCTTTRQLPRPSLRIVAQPQKPQDSHWNEQRTIPMPRVCSMFQPWRSSNLFVCVRVIWLCEKSKRIHDYFSIMSTHRVRARKKKKTFRVLLFVFSLAVRVTNPPAVQLNYASDSNTFPNDY